ncbi:MAG: SHOCT domain-containing protein [Gammaproteobacteria bacterium]|nr:MAG: SHOCT domain-containing protein [Gammaproteobacteria bacterium]
MKKSLLILLTLVSVGCVSTTTHYGSRPDLSSLKIGMTQEEVYKAIGKPAKVSSQGAISYLSYGWDDPWDGRIGAAEEYYVRLLNGKLESFGEKGDFDSTKNPTLDVNTKMDINVDQRSTEKDFYTEITKLKSLLDAGAITQAEYDAKKKTLLANP